MSSKMKKHVTNKQNLTRLKAKAFQKKLSRKDILKIKESSNSELKRDFLEQQLLPMSIFYDILKIPLLKILQR